MKEVDDHGLMGGGGKMIGSEASFHQWGNVACATGTVATMDSVGSCHQSFNGTPNNYEMQKTHKHTGIVVGRKMLMSPTFPFVVLVVC